MSWSETAGAGEDTDRGGAGGFGIVGGRSVAFEPGRRGVERKTCMATCVDSSLLALPLVLEHEATSAVDLVARAAAGAAEHGVGQLVQAELMHLAGQPNLGVGIEPQAKEPLGRVPRRARRHPCRRPAAAPALHAAARSRCPSAGPRRRRPVASA